MIPDDGVVDQVHCLQGAGTYPGVDGAADNIRQILANTPFHRRVAILAIALEEKRTDILVEVSRTT